MRKEDVGVVEKNLRYDGGKKKKRTG